MFVIMKCNTIILCDLFTITHFLMIGQQSRGGKISLTFFYFRVKSRERGHKSKAHIGKRGDYLGDR